VACSSSISSRRRRVGVSTASAAARTVGSRLCGPRLEHDLARRDMTLGEVPTERCVLASNARSLDMSEELDADRLASSGDQTSNTPRGPRGRPRFLHRRLTFGPPLP